MRKTPIVERLSRRPVLVLLAVCALAWLPGFFSLPPLDRDESRFAQASKQMIESGDYIDIRFTTVPRYNKPAGAYWLQSASTLAFGKPPYNQIWTYRLPSLLGALMAVLLTYWCARAFAAPPGALVAAALLGVTVLLTAEARIATTDALLLAAIVAAQGFLFRAYLAARGQLAAAPSSRVALAAWAALGAGILLKGPVIVGVVGLTALAVTLWDRDIRWLRNLRAGLGVPVMLAVVLPWAIAIALASHGAFYERSLGHDFAAKLVAGQESHGAPPGYYLALASLTLWPATLFALPAIGAAIARRTNPAIRFLLCWAAPTWLLFELIPTKLPHYVLPVYPALAMLAGLWAMGSSAGDVNRSWLRALRILAALQFVVVAIGAAALLIALPYRFGLPSSGWVPLAATAVVLVGLAAAVLAILRKFNPAICSAVLAALLLYPVLVAVSGHDLHRIWISERLAHRISADRRPGEAIVLAGYVEPSLVFLLGTSTRIESGRRAGEIAAQRGGLALVEDRAREKFLKALQERRARSSVIDAVSGFNYSRGRNEHVTIYRVVPAPRTTPPPPE